MYGSAFVAVPTRGLVDTQVAGAVSQLALRLGTSVHYERGHLSAGMTRNKIVASFLASGLDVLVMVDDDVVPTANAHSLLERLGEFDIVGASYPIFRPELGWPLPVPPAFQERDGDYELAQAIPSGVLECDAVGTGCVAICREVLEQIQLPFAETMTSDGFDIVSDDFVFCKRARDAGYRIGMDFDVRCDHLVRVSLGSILNGVAVHARQAALTAV